MAEVIQKGKLQVDTVGLRDVSGRNYGARLADTTALAAIKVISRQDGMIAIVAPAALWVFDATSAAAGSGTVIVPAAGSGRWLKTT